MMVRVDGHLMIASAQIDRREHFRAVETIHEVVYAWDRVAVYFGVRVQSAKVNTHTHGAILLLHEEEGMAIGTGTLADPTLRE